VTRLKEKKLEDFVPFSPSITIAGSVRTETSRPSQVNVLGIDSPGENALVESWKDTAAPDA
jgi:hypothetical protein